MKRITNFLLSPWGLAVKLVAPLLLVYACVDLSMALRSEARSIHRRVAGRQDEVALSIYLNARQTHWFADSVLLTGIPLAIILAAHMYDEHKELNADKTAKQS